MSPQHVGIVDAVKLFFSNYTNFNGRSTRSEYWWVVLAATIFGGVLGFVLGFISGVSGSDGPSSLLMIIVGIVELAIIIPSLSLCVRRLHDVGKSGWFFLLVFVPIASIYLLYLYCQPSTGSNQWGEPA